MNNQAQLQSKNSVQSVNKVSSPIGGIHFFGNGDQNATNHLKIIQFEYQTLQEGIQHLEDMIKYSAENHENLVRDKFLVKKNRLSRKKREIYEQEQQLQRQEMELNSNPQIKRALFDLSQLKEFHERKERQYRKISEIIDKEDETLKALKTTHESRIDKLKHLISINIETQMRIDKIKKHLRLRKKQSLGNTHTMSQPNLPAITMKDNNSMLSQSQSIQQQQQVLSDGGILITQTGIIPNNSVVNKQQSKASQLGISLEQTYQSQLPTINTSTSQNISKHIVKSNVFKNIGQAISNPTSTKAYRNNKVLGNLRYEASINNSQGSILSHSISAVPPSLLKNIKANNENTFSQNSSIVQQQASIINPNGSSILATNEFDDLAWIEQAQGLLVNELDQVKKDILNQKREIEKKRNFVYKHCNNQLQLNHLVKECFNLVSKKLNSTLSMSDKTGFKDSMYLTIRNNSQFVTQNEQIISDFKDLQHNNNVNVQDRLLGSIVFDSMMNIIRKQEQEKLNKQKHFPLITYKNFSQFTLGQLLTILTLKPELKDQLFLPFEFKKQTIHLFLDELQRRV